MKIIVTSFALSLAMCAAAGATAQTKSAAPAFAADTVLLSESTDGDYLVRKFLLKHHDDTGYSVRYQINLAKLSSTLNGNAAQLGDLNAFVENLMNDTLMQVKSVHITGYSSPDGPMKRNETLARNRASDFKQYVDTKYCFSKKYHVTINSVAEDWDMCRALVAQSSMPDKQSVLKIIDGTQSHDAKELAIKRVPAAWNYMKTNILPPLRRVELMIDYGQGNIVEQRTMIRQPAPISEPEPECCPGVYVDESITGIIVEMPNPASDFDKMTRKEVKQARREVAAAEKMANKEARKINKLAKQEIKAAEKIAKVEAKAARKAAKEAEKMARKAAKMLDKM